MFTRITFLISLFYSFQAYTMPSEVVNHSKKAYEVLAKQSSFQKKMEVLNNYKSQIQSIKKTMKSEMDLIEYYGLTSTLDELQPKLLKAKRCNIVEENLKSKFYPRGIASKDGPTHYKYALKFLKPFCN